MFIRTKDGIYELTGKPNEISITNNVLYSCWDENGENEIIIRDDEIIMQSDNLAELCDGFYVDKCKEEFLYDEIFDECWYDFNSYFKECAKNGIDVYGFIKTDKGLIYVAKINEDGELVLI